MENSTRDVEKSRVNEDVNQNALTATDRELPRYNEQIMQQRISARKTAPRPFAGRIGGNQEFVADVEDEANQKLLEEEPDAAPGMSLKQQFDLRQFRSLGLWRAAFSECLGTFLLVFITVWTNTSPNVLPVAPTAKLGDFDNASFFGPLVGSLINFIMLSLSVFTFGPVSGGHLNPTITMSAFFARLCTFPRMVLYITFQVIGGTIAGLLVRAAYGSRDFKTGGCWLFPDEVAVGGAFAVEFVACVALIFYAYGVGLDPRQRAVIPPALSPFLVGLALGVLSLSTAYARYGYGGASMNPARCFGSFVGSSFPSWHWYQWVADFCGCLFFGVFHYLVPPTKIP